MIITLINAVILGSWLTYTAITSPNHFWDMFAASTAALVIGLRVGVDYE